MEIHLNPLQTAALRSHLIEADKASAAANAAQATASAYIAAILQGLEYEASTPIKSMDLKGSTGTITLEIKNAETEGRT